ncbi:MAG: hypothetical protein H6568_01300 [Lewinellaceae bacterium]|nr:hypothetical protein [Saprospiraceae bacterium]MCB9311374.1 hypothetical protein [Lewinellaceae bacterium]HRW74647.1 AsmA-like C-terminal region-containing protein [Saprospiraceae bacterium]
MRILRRILIILSILTGLFLAAALILPSVFKDDVLAVLREEANKDLRATIDFSDIDLSLFRQFPLLSVQIDDLSIVGKDAFDGYPFLTCSQAEVALSVWDLIRSDAPLRIKRLFLDDPSIQVLVLEDGSANYDLTYPDTTLQATPEVATPIQGAIESYRISNGRIRYDDRTMPFQMDMIGLNHSGTGDFTQSQFVLQTSTTIDTLNMVYDGTSYLSRVKASMEADLDVDLDQMRFAFGSNQMQLNDLSLVGEGSISMPEEDIVMDLRFSSPQSDIRHVWSMIPGAYTRDYAALKATGTFALDAWMKGTYSETSFPAFSFKVNIGDGQIQYPDLPVPIEDLALDLHLEQPGNQLEAMTISMPVFQVTIKDQSIRGHLNAKDLFTDPFVDLEAAGGLDLAVLQQAFPLEAAQLAGQISLDLGIRARMSDLDAARVDAVDLHGQASVRNILYQTSGQPSLGISSGTIQFSPQAVSTKDLVIQAGKSDLQINARFDNVLAFLHPERTLKGQMTVRSQLIDLDEWSSTSTEEDVATEPTSDSPAELPVQTYDLSVDMTVGKLIANQMTIEKVRLNGTAGPTVLNIAELAAQLGPSDVRIQGQMENLLGWLAGNAELRGQMRLDSRFLDLNQFMPESAENGSPSEDAYAPIPVPAQVNMTTTAHIDHLIYTDLDLRQVDAQLNVINEEIRLSQFDADGLGGKIALAGSYNTQDLSKPAFHLKYDFQKLDFQKVFSSFPSFAMLAPIGKYIQGNFSSNMMMDGILGQDMMPDLATLEAAGFLETFNSVVKGFKPLEGLAQKLNVKELKNLDLKGTKNWFEFRNGMLELKDFDYSYQDILMTIGGSHSLTQDMNYHVKARIPRKLMEKNAVTASATSGLKWIESEAAKKGIPVSLGEYVNVLVKIGGNISSPTYAVQLLGADGQGATVGEQLGNTAADITQQAKDSLRRLGEKKVQEASEQIRKEAQQKLDTLKKQANQQVDTALARAREEAAKKAEEVLGKEVGKKIEEIGGDKAKEEADKIKEKLKNWDPLKKKKDGQ